MASIGQNFGLSRLFQGGVGSLFNRVLGAVGVVDTVSETESAAIRAKLADGVERSPALIMRKLDEMFGRAVPPGGFVPAPWDQMQAKVQGPRPQGFPKAALSPQTSPETRRFLHSVDVASMRDPWFRGQMNATLKGTLLPGTSENGSALVLKNAPVGAAAPGRAGVGPLGVPLVNTETNVPNMPLPPPGFGNILGGLRQWEANVASLAKGLTEDKAAPAGNAQALTADPADPMDPVQTALDVVQQGMDGPPGVDGMPMGKAMMGNAGQGDMSDTMKQQMLQYQVENLKKFYELLTSIIRSMHDMQMEAVRNIA